MKQPEAETLARAGVLEIAVIMFQDGAWNVWLYGENHRDVARQSGLEAARGGPRNFASIDTAYRWIRALPGPAIKISVD